MLRKQTARQLTLSPGITNALAAFSFPITRFIGAATFGLIKLNLTLHFFTLIMVNHKNPYNSPSPGGRELEGEGTS